MSIVLAPHGGAFPLLVVPFRYGFGGWLGPGDQYTPWITIRDAVGALLHLLDRPGCHGGFNGTVPEPTQNRAWAEAFGRVIDRPVRTHAPKWAMRGALGELAEQIFLSSCRATPRKLVESGYRFQDTDPEAAFRWLVDRLEQEKASGRAHG